MCSVFVLSGHDNGIARLDAIGSLIGASHENTRPRSEMSRGHRPNPKVSAYDAENLPMENEIYPPDSSNDPDFQRARVLSLSVGAIRKAQGKKSPGDFPVGSVEWHVTVEDFANDVLKAMLAESDSPILEFRRDNARK